MLRNPEILECAAVAVPADSTEDEILLFAVKSSGSSIGPQELCAGTSRRAWHVSWCRATSNSWTSSEDPSDWTPIIKVDLRQRGLGPHTWDRQSQGFRTQESAVSN